MDYLEIAHNAVKRAVAAGYEAEAYIATGQHTEIQVDKGVVEKLSYAGSKGIGMRVLQGGRMGYAYTSDFSPDSINRTVDEAITLASVSDADEHRMLPEAHPMPEKELDIYDPVIPSTATDAKIEFARALEAAALATDPRIRLTNRTSYFDNTAKVFLVNSNGFSGSYEQTMAAGFLMAMAFDGQERATGFNVKAACRLHELDPEEIGRGAGEKAVRLLGSRPISSQQATVVYSPYAAVSLIGALARALTGEAMQRNRSFLQGKMGSVIASDVVTLLDNGLLPGGLASRPFDDEGVPSGATRLIDEGVLQAVLYDNYTAKRDGKQSTGNAVRSSHRQPPSLGPSNFYIQPGNQTPENIIAGVDRGLYVLNVMNTASINPVSGDYSVAAQGIWIENGKLTHPVSEVTIALPLDQLLHNVVAVGNDLTFLPFGGSLGSPTLRVDGVMIGGAGPS